MLLKRFGSALCVVGLVASAHAESRPITSAPEKPADAPTNPASGAPAPFGAVNTNPEAKSGQPYANILQAPLFKTSTPGSSEAKIDESALRYYAAQKNKKRTEAEIRRLKTLYPSWVVPTDLYAKAGTGSDEQALWDLFATGDMLALRTAINDRMRKEVGWAPSRDLTHKMERQDAINKLVVESNSQHWTRVVELADAEPSVLSCTSIDADWRVAEAFARMDMHTRTFDIYRAILASCVDREERIATVRKAITLLAPADVKVLIALGEHRADGRNEFESVRADLTRARFNAIAAGTAADDLQPEEIKAFGEAASQNRSAADASLLAWYWYAQQKWAEADRWFKSGLEFEENAKLAEGHALSLRNSGDLPAAKKFAYEWRDRAAKLRAIYVGISIEELTKNNPAPNLAEADLKPFIDLVNADSDANGGQAVAWYHYNRKEWPDAVTWFKTSLDWSAHGKGDAKPAEKTIEGYALALQNMGRMEEAESVAYSAIDQGANIRALYINIMNAQFNKTEPALQISQSRLDRFGAIVTADKSPSGAQALAWYYQRNQAMPTAIEWFKSAVAWSGDGGDAKINEGYAMALSSAGRVVEAEDIAYEWSDRAPNMRSTYFNTIIAQMNKPEYAAKMTEPRIQRFANFVMQDHSDDGAQAMGWFRFRQKGRGYGVNWFKLASQWSPERAKDPKTIEGYAASLRLAGRLSEAENVAYPNIALSDRIKKLYVEIVAEELTHDNPPEPMPEARLANFLAVVSPEKDAMGAQALGWYRLERHENTEAAKLFRDALDWWPAQDTLKRADKKTYEDYKPLLAKLALTPETYRKSPRAYSALAASSAQLPMQEETAFVDTVEGFGKTTEGYALALRDTGDISEAETIAYAWRDRSPGLRQLFFDIAISELTRENSSVEIDVEHMTRYVRMIESDHSVAGAQALAWHASVRKQWQVSANWFKLSFDWADNAGEKSIDAKAAEGYVAALRNLGQIDEAEALVGQWRDRSPALRHVYVELALEQLRRLKPETKFPEDKLARLTVAVQEEKSSSGAQALGWYLYGLKDYETALNWFQSANSWTPDGKGDAKSMEGYATTLKALGRNAEALAIATEWRGKSPEMQALYMNAMGEMMVKDGESDKLTDEQMTTYAAAITEKHDAQGALSLGWYRFGQKNNGYAVNWFKNSIEWSADGKGDAKTNESYALALHNIGRLAEAETVLYPWIEKNEGMKKLYINIVSEELTRDAPPEPIDQPRLAQFIDVITPMKSALGAQALGWYRHQRGEEAEALVWFKNALDWWPSIIGATPESPFIEGYQPILAKLALIHENYQRTPHAYEAPWVSLAKPLPEYTKTFIGLARTWQGYALALHAAGRIEEAEKIAYDWRDKWPGLRKLYIDIAVQTLSKPDSPVIEADRFGRFRQVFEADRLGTGAQALGWYSNNHKDYAEASNWFKTALSWRPAKADPANDAKIYEGYIMALRGEQKFNEAFNLASQWRDQSQNLKKQYLASASDVLQNTGSNEPVANAVLEQMVKSASTDRAQDTAQSLGWYYYGQKDLENAQIWFKNAMNWAPQGKLDPKTVEGVALTMRASGKATEALDFAYDMRDKAPNMRELYVELASDILGKDGPSGKIAPQTIAKTVEIVTTDHNAKGAQALGWYRFARKDFAGSVEMFKNAIVWSTDGKGDEKAAEGYARSLRALGRYEEAETVAYGWYEESEAMRGLYIEVVSEKLSRATSAYAMSEEALRRFAAAVTRQSSANGAQALAWYSYNVGQVRPAAAWFEKALSWEPSEGSAVGLALSYKKLNDRNSFMRTIEMYRDRYSKVADLLRASYAPGPRSKYDLQQQPFFDQPQPAPRAVAPRASQRGPVSTEPTGSAGGNSGSMSAALAKKDYGGCLRIADGLIQSGRLGSADSTTRGWCLLNMGRAQEAAAAFDRALQAGATGRARDDAAYGKSLALLKNGATLDAGYAAQQGVVDPQHRNDVGVEVLAQQARAAYKAGQVAQALEILNRRNSFAAETRDLMLLRGWCLLKLGQFDSAKRIFQIVDTQMSTGETQAGLTAVNAAITGH